jgi:hypothetical protein
MEEKGLEKEKEVRLRFGHVKKLPQQANPKTAKLQIAVSNIDIAKSEL